MNRLPSRRPFPLPSSKLKVATVHIKKFLLQSMKWQRGGFWRNDKWYGNSLIVFIFVDFHKALCHKAGMKGSGWQGGGFVDLGQRLCGMKYMHKAKRSQQADKLTTPQPWHRWHLDTYQYSVSFLLPVQLRGRHGEAGLRWGCFYAGKLWAVEFNLEFTSDIVPPWLSSYWARFMEWDSGVFSLWLAGLRPAMHRVL